MTRRARTVLPALLGLAAASTALVVPTTATAGAPGTWSGVATTSSPASLTTTVRPSAVRDDDGFLHVVHVQDDGEMESLRHTVLGDDGAVETSSVVLQGLSSIHRDPEVVATPSGLRIVFGGIRIGGSDDPYRDSGAYHATLASGADEWVLQASRLATTRGINGWGAADLRGTTYVATISSAASTPGLRGQTVAYRSEEIPLTGGSPAVVNDPEFMPDPAQSTGPVVDAEVVAVPATGEVWVAWTADDGRPEAGQTTDLTVGTFVRRIAPSLGEVRRAPASFYPDGVGGVFAAALQNGPSLTATPAGDVVLAYGADNPRGDEQAAVWTVGDAAPVFVPGAVGASYADVS